MGSRLDLPHPVRAFLALPDEGRAREASEQLGNEGFSCQLRSTADGWWLVTSVIRMVPTPESTSSRTNSPTQSSLTDG